MPPRTAIKRITTKSQTNNSQNCQKIELYGSPTTKDLKKPYSSRWAGGAEMQRQGGEARRLGVAWRGGSNADKMGTGSLIFMCGR